MNASITLKPNQLEGTLVAWVTDDGDCTGIEWFAADASIPDYRNGEAEISCKLTGRCVSAWLALNAGGIFANGRRDLTFRYDDARRKLTVA